MNALIATTRLTNFAGSEITAIEVAHALRKKGHRPVLFAHAIADPVRKHLAEAELPVRAGSRPKLKDFDLVWSQHFVYPLLIGDSPPTAGGRRPYFCFVHLGPFEPYEAPLPILEEILADEILANSPTTRDTLTGAGIPGDRVTILSNAAPAEFQFRRATLHGTLKRLLVITNHMLPEMRGAVDLLARESGVHCQHIGLGGLVRRVTPEDIRNADAVMTIGKSAQYALLSAAPVYCYGVFGGPGWLKEQNFDLAEYFNFAGRCCRRKLSGREIALEIIEGYPSAARFAQQLSSQDLSRFVLETHLERILAVAAAGVTWKEEQVSAITANAAQIRRLRAVAQVIERHIEVEVSNLARFQSYDRRLCELQRSHASLISELENERLRLQQQQSESEQLSQTKEVQREELAELRERAVRLEQRVKEIEESLSWRLTAPLRGVLTSIRRILGR